MEASTLTLELTAAPSAADLDLVDAGLHAANCAAADLDSVRPLGVFVRDRAGSVVAGLRARSWGRAAEIQQLWVRPDLRRQGLATRLMQAAEGALAERGCGEVMLETYSWQAPALHMRLGYRVAAQFEGMPDDGVRFVLRKTLRPTDQPNEEPSR